MVPKWVQKWFNNGPKMGSKMVENGPLMVQKGPKGFKKGPNIFLLKNQLAKIANKRENPIFKNNFDFNPEYH